MQYRRSNVGGGTYFFTVNLAERNRTLLVDHVDELRAVMKVVKQRHPFHIDAVAVLPDHLHVLWTLPRDDADFATRWMLIKHGWGERSEPQRPTLRNVMWTGRIRVFIDTSRRK